MNSVLRNEITRLARKEVRRLVDPLSKTVSAQRHEIAALKRTAADQQRNLKAVARVQPAVATGGDVDLGSFRFWATGL